MNISPIDKILLRCIAKVLEEKQTLVKIGIMMYDQQFMSIVSFSGFPTHITTLSNEIDYLESIGLIQRIVKDDKYMGNSVHYVLTELGYSLL